MNRQDREANKKRQLVVLEDGTMSTLFVHQRQTGYYIVRDGYHVSVVPVDGVHIRWRVSATSQATRPSRSR